MRHVQILAPLAALAVFAVWHAAYPLGLVDDAYIPLTYARNLLEGHGIVFYPGGERVEGFTSPIWLSLMSLGGLTGAPLPYLAHWCSVTFGLAGVALTVFIYFKRFGEHASLFWTGVAGLALAADISFAAWSSSGLESSLYSLCLLALVWACLARIHIALTASALTLLCLIRPEGVVFLPLALYRIFEERKRRLRSALWLAGLWVAPMLLFFFSRYAYFGEWLPNTFYAKHDFGGFELWYRGAAYVLSFLLPRPLLWLAPLVLWLDRKHRRTHAFILAAAGLHTTAVIAEGGDHFALHRFLMPALPLLCICSVRILQIAVSYAHDRASFTRPRLAGVLALTLLAAGLYAYSQLIFHFEQPDDYRFSTGARRYLSEVEWTRNWKQVGLWLNKRYPEGTPIAVTTAGAIPFYSELPAVDLFGLNTKAIARAPARPGAHLHPGHEKSDPEHVLNMQPAYIQLFPLLFFSSHKYPVPRAYHDAEARREWLESMLIFPAQFDLWNHPRFQEEYEFKTLETEHGYISIFERKGLND